jgi:hypothetical protein
LPFACIVASGWLLLVTAVTGLRGVVGVAAHVVAVLDQFLLDGILGAMPALLISMRSCRLNSQCG